MNKNVYKYLQEREKINQLYDAPKYRRLKYAALAVIAVTIILLCLTFWTEKISPKAMLIMRGCAGLAAIVFGVLYGLLSYRVNKEHIANRKK